VTAFGAGEIGLAGVGRTLLAGHRDNQEERARPRPAPTTAKVTDAPSASQCHAAETENAERRGETNDAELNGVGDRRISAVASRRVPRR
jgi:hypothetical protein